VPKANDYVNHPERFWERLERLPSGCWVWPSKSPDYVQVRYGTVKTAVHRIAFFITHGRWPEPCGLHSCDNPPCCNPAHIFEGTREDNNADRDKKGRHVPLRGEAHGGRKLSAAEVAEIRATYSPSKGPSPNEFSTNALAKKYGVTQGAIWRIVNDRTWKAD
jgi:hypothetical protein